MLRLLRRACRRANLVFCLNTQELRFLVEQGWVEPERVHLLANPAPPSFFVPREHRPRAQRLLFVGQWLNMKGTRYLAAAFSRLLRENPDLQLCCAGTLASPRAVLRAFPEDVRDHVIVRPRVSKSELLEIHRTSDLFVFPTLSEGFSLALIEAMASGLPVVTTPVGASCDILQDGSSVVFCAPNDADSLAARVADLLDDRERREMLGRNAQLAASKFRPELVWRDYAVCLNQLAERDIEDGRRMTVARVAERD
jgi:glycosyltransferase involved in cell wall biosynthesis